MKKKTLSFGTALVALMLLINPTLHIYDALPDFVGGAMLYFALKRVANVDAYFEDARTLSVYVFWYGLVKFVGSFTSLSTGDNALPFTFFASVIEGVLYTFLLVKIFDGFHYTAMRNDGEAVASVADKTRNVVIVSHLLRCALSFLPELIIFVRQTRQIHPEDVHTALPTHLYGYALGLSFVLSLAVFGYALWTLCRFMSVVKKSPAYREKLTDKCLADETTNRLNHQLQTLSVALLLFSAAELAVFPFRADGVSYTAYGLTALPVFAALFTAKRVAPERKISFLPCVFMTVFAACLTVFDGVCALPLDCLISGNVGNMPATGRLSFVTGNACVWIYGALFAGLFVSAVFAVLSFIGVIKYFCKREILGSFDRSLLTFSALYLLALLCRGMSDIYYYVTAKCCAHTDVAEYLHARMRMTDRAMTKEILENTAIAVYEKADTASFVFGAAAVVFVICAVLATAVFRGKLNGEKDI